MAVISVTVFSRPTVSPIVQNQEIILSSTLLEVEQPVAEPAIRSLRAANWKEIDLASKAVEAVENIIQPVYLLVDAGIVFRLGKE